MLEVREERINTSRRMVHVAETERDSDYLVYVIRNYQLTGNL